MLQKAFERYLEIIVEAVKRVLDLEQTYTEKITDVRPIVSLRNYIIHFYDSVSHENTWFILTRHLPKLKNDVES